MRIAAWAILCAIGLLQQAPPRDMPVFATAGTGSITGTVVSEDKTPAPMRRALVTLTRAGLEDIRTTSTDERGRYTFVELPSGTYSLSASKGGYLSARYGALQVNMPGSAIPIRDAQRFSADPIALTRGGVIAGRIVDRFGRPLANILVLGVRVVTVNGERRPGSGGRGTTNAHGEYRMFGLPPDEYVVYAEMPRDQMLLQQITAETLTWAQQPATTAPPASERPAMYASTVYPGTTDQSVAVPIVLARGEERTDVDFAMQSVRVVRVTGVVTRPDGQPAAGVSVVRALKQRAMIPDPGQATTTDAAGVFTFTSMPPGEYVLLARGAPAGFAYAADPTSGSRGLGAGPGNMAAQQPWWGATDIQVAGEDLLDRAIRLQPGISVSGRVVFKNTTPASRVTITLTPTSTAAAASVGAEVLPGADGLFKIEGVMPATFRVVASVTTSAVGMVGTQPTVTVQSIMHAGKDLADVPLDVNTGDITDVVVTMSDQMAGLSGVLTDAAGRPTPQYYVFMFPVDRALWTTNSRRIRAVRADVNGAYSVTGLPAGEYFVSAATAIDTALQYDTTYLEQFVPLAIKMTLGESERRTQNLGVGGR